jgi:hypothetical protein
MRKTFTCTVLACCLANVLFANVFRINSNLVTDATQKIYNTINEANTAAVVVNGDTLMVEGSSVPYAAATITKRLVLIGPGYLLANNPQTQASSSSALMSTLSLAAGSDGSVLMGLTFSASSSNTPSINVSNVVVMRCYMSNNIQLLGNISNIQILQNYFASAAFIVTGGTDRFSNVVLNNNIINNSGFSIFVPFDNTYQRSFSAVENNVLVGGAVNVTSTTFRNNIITTSNTGSFNIASGSILNNLVANGQIPTGNGNQTYDAANLFIGLSGSGNSPDGQYKLKSTSPYLTAGYNGTQSGLFGGSQPYVLSGIPPIPTIYEFTPGSFGDKINGLPISIKVKANQ